MQFVKIIIGLILLVTILFFFLGLRSQKGTAAGLNAGSLSCTGSAPNCVSSADAEQPEKSVPPLGASLSEARTAIIATGGTIISETDSYISATYMSKIFKFVDDVEVVDAGEGRLNIRSSSRVGYSDRGVNKKRVTAIRDALK